MLVISQGKKLAKASSPPPVKGLAKLNASSVTELMLEKRNSVQHSNRNVALTVK